MLMVLPPGQNKGRFVFLHETHLTYSEHVKI
uniref:Uncharacterized protein n=1 Tax=Anguilla anguilla TaxID=7936 RepID=A0A0E9UFJ4_ANGAN